MIIRDEARIAKDKRGQISRDKWDQNMARLGVAKRDSQAFTQGNGARSKVNAASQWGQILKTEDFERRLKKVVPGIWFEEFSREDMVPQVLSGKWPAGKPWHHKRLMHNQWLSGPEHLPGAVCVALYARDHLPEFSTMYEKSVEIPNPEYISTGKVATSDSELSMTVTVPDGIARRSWREILVILAQAGLANRTAIELEFGAAHTPEWAQKFKGDTSVVTVG